MHRKTISIFISFVLILILMGCNLPQSNSTQSPDQAYTQAALTVEAELTLVAAEASPTPAVPSSTSTPNPTSTFVPSATKSPIPCNQALFVSDVTIPDNTVETAGTTFTKTWRLRNIGTCTWNSSYQLVFYHGDAMGVPTGYAQTLTSGYVSPGQDVDATVNLTAPMNTGTYKGYWGFREPGGSIFTSFVVVIQVPAAASHTLTVSSVASEGGYVQSDGVVTAYPNIGDLSTNVGVQAFISFDISAIPTNATITQVQMDLTTYDILGNPFGHLGCIKVYPQNYVIPLGPGAYIPGPAPTNEDHDWCSTSDLNSPQTDNDFKTDLQAKIGTSSRLQYRLEFTTATNNDGITDMVRLGAPKLIVNYTSP